MITKEQIEAQLKRLGVTVRSWGAAEKYELCNILMPHEEITAYVHGWYENGFATLLTTTERLLLVDKKAFNLTIEDVRYDMIAEVDFNARLMDATVRINTINKELRFTSMKQRRLRELTSYIQKQIMELRQQPQQFTWQQFEQSPEPQRQAEPVMQPQLVSHAPAPGPAALPLRAPQLATFGRFTPVNHFARPALTTKHQFLPKVPRRWRPS